MPMKNCVKISVIIPVRESDTSLLNDKLFKLISKRYPSDIQVIVVDDFSPTPMEHVANAYAVEYVRLDDPTPWNQAAAKNAGLAVALGEYVCATDVDVTFSVDDLIKLYEHKDDNDIVIGKIMVPSGTNGQWKEHPMWQERINCFSIIHKKCLDKIGGYDERFRGFYGFEDEITFWKLRNVAKAKIKWVPFEGYMARIDKGSSHDQKLQKDIQHGMNLFEKVIGEYPKNTQ